MRPSLASNNALWIALPVRPSVRPSVTLTYRFVAGKRQDRKQRQKPAQSETCGLSRKFKMSKSRSAGSSSHVTAGMNMY